jgi:hypothetical protein
MDHRIESNTNRHHGGGVGHFSNWERFRLALHDGYCIYSMRLRIAARDTS